jgi:phosphoglycolate phosphatase
VPSSQRAGVLFDLDGVLVDSRAAITSCINHALLEHELPVHPPEALYRYIGPPLACAFAELTGHPAGSALVAACVSSYRSRYADVSLSATVVIPGIDRVLAGLAGRYRLAVATSKPVEFAEPLLRAVGLRSYFTAVAGPALSIGGETKASTIAAALERLGRPRQAVMVGDRSYDVVGAHAHAVPSIGVSWGIGSVAELRQAGAGSIVNAPGELPAAIARLLSWEPKRFHGRT